MSSSISSSEPPPWRAFALAFAATAALLFMALIAATVALDPYDTGRFALVRVPGVWEQGPRTAHASRGRDPAFDGAIFGNSHLQLVSPEALSRATGIPFVSLTVPATGPKEQFALIDYFLAHRVRPARALILGIDGYWCTPDPAFPNWQPFPFWLYDPRDLAYLAGLVRLDALQRLPRRLGYILSGGRKRARPDGYWDYEQYRTWRAEVIGPSLALPQASTVLNESGRFPAADRLADRLARLSPDLAVVLVRPPVFYTALPQPGTPLARSEDGCRAAFGRVAAARPGTALVDWRRDRPENRAITNYFDHTHYRAAVARALEADIAAALRRLSEGGGA